MSVYDGKGKELKVKDKVKRYKNKYTQKESFKICTISKIGRMNSSKKEFIWFAEGGGAYDPFNFEKIEDDVYNGDI